WDGRHGYGHVRPGGGPVAMPRSLVEDFTTSPRVVLLISCGTTSQAINQVAPSGATLFETGV
ncbi:MAG: hypothetical protein ACK5F7_05570, partial [Planctomycetaceae bacterium]